MNDTVFQRHRHPKQESWQHWYRPLGTAAVTKLDNTVAVRSGNAAHSERCAGKTHTSYMTTWRSVGVRRGNVAYCLAFSAHTHHLYICTHMSWYRHVLRGTGCWDRGLSCEKAKRNVPVLRVHIIAFWWYFLGNEVLCFFIPACHTTGLAWIPLYDYTTLHFCRLVQCITVSYWASVGPVPLVFYCASVFTSLVPCPVPSVCM